MKTNLLSTLILSPAIILSACTKNNSVNNTPKDVKTEFTTIDGTWRCTAETVLKMPNGVLEAVIKISGSTENNLTVNGCFMWDGRYYNDWPLSEYHFTDSLNQIFIKDNEGSFFVGTVNKELTKITGTVYSGDYENPVPEDKLDFIRANDSLANKLFFPRIPNPDRSITYSYSAPQQINDGIETASLLTKADTTAIYELMKRIIQQEWGRLESLLILKDNKLLVEEYFYGFNRNQIHNIHSCTKSVVSLLFGMVLEKHPEISLNQSVFDFFPEYNSLKNSENKKITLEHLLTMTAGFNPDSDIENYMPEDLYRYILSIPLGREPGTKFEYSNESTELIGGIINSLSGKYADELAKESLFNSLGITNYLWETENDRPHCYSDLWLQPRDMAKIGLLVLNNGKWNGKQIVPKEWIQVSTKPHVQESESFDYGYQWWCRSNKKNKWWNSNTADNTDEHELCTALGFGGQFIMVIRDLNLVVVTTSSDYNEKTGKWLSKIPMVVDEIVPVFE